MRHPSIQPCVPISWVLACFLRGPGLCHVFGGASISEVGLAYLASKEAPEPVSRAILS